MQKDSKGNNVTAIVCCIGVSRTLSGAIGWGPGCCKRARTCGMKNDRVPVARADYVQHGTARSCLKSRLQWTIQIYFSRAHLQVRYSILVAQKTNRVYKLACISTFPDNTRRHPNPFQDTRWHPRLTLTSCSYTLSSFHSIASSTRTPKVAFADSAPPLPVKPLSSTETTMSCFPGPQS